MNEIKRKIKGVMEEEDIRNLGVAKATGILKNNISIILSEKGNPRWATVHRILQAIGYEVILKKKEPF